MLGAFLVCGLKAGEKRVKRSIASSYHGICTYLAPVGIGFDATSLPYAWRGLRYAGTKELGRIDATASPDSPAKR